MLSHRALISHLDQIDRLGFLNADTVLLAALPLFHVFGLNAVLGSWVRSGARMVIMDGFAGLFDVIADEGVTNLPVAPALLPEIIADERSAYALGHVDHRDLRRRSADRGAAGCSSPLGPDCGSTRGTG